MQCPLFKETDLMFWLVKLYNLWSCGWQMSRQQKDLTSNRAIAHLTHSTIEEFHT